MSRRTAESPEVQEPLRIRFESRPAATSRLVSLMPGVRAAIGGSALRDIQTLQKLAGNRALNTLLRSSAPGPLLHTRTIQRKAMSSASLGAGVVERGEGAIFDSPHIQQGKVFVKKCEIEQDGPEASVRKYHDEIRAIAQTIGGRHFLDRVLPDRGAQWNLNVRITAEELADLSNDFDLLLEANKVAEFEKTKVGNQDFKTKVRWWYGKRNRTALRNKDYIGLVDPFLVRLTIEVRSKRAQDLKSISILTQFATSGTGYITQLRLSRRNGQELTGTIRSAADFARDARSLRPPGGLIFSSTHDTADESMLQARAASLWNAPWNATGEPAGGRGIAFDAVTWLAAEGARFQIIAQNMGTLKKTTHFYDSVSQKAVSLSWLVRHWGTDFEKKYDISADTVRRIVRSAPDDDGLVHYRSPRGGWLSLAP